MTTIPLNKLWFELHIELFLFSVIVELTSISSDVQQVKNKIRIYIRKNNFLKNKKQIKKESIK